MISKEIKKKIEDISADKIKSADSLSGGCISNAYKIEFFSGNLLLLKIHNKSDMFFKESNGLKELRKANAVRVPEVIAADEDFILLEFIRSKGTSKNFFHDFGRNFAMLHKSFGKTYGFFEDNYIGSTPQKNLPEKDEENNWIKFYWNKRLMFQFRLAEKNGYADESFRKLFGNLEEKIEEIIFTNEPPSLLHGDLWSGNFMSDENGEACIIDPAVYYGNREADLAMTKLFGGFSSDFYKSYNAEYPLPDGYNYREDIYKLYHLLNHLNLFGRGYYTQVVAAIRRYV